jgi:16S rRNA (uracil1498-N3)-methyltransferase
MKRRFFVDKAIEGNLVVLDGPEASHITTVNRLGPGDEILLFDGTDREFLARIVDARKNQVQAEIRQIQSVSRELPFRLCLAVALPRGDRQKILVEKLVELGVTTLFPVACDRSVALPEASAVRRLHRRVIEASKQCGRNRLMGIARPVTYNEFVGMEFEGLHRFIAHPGGPSKPAVAVNRRLPPTDGVVIAIGPEGGFSDCEIDLASRSGWNCLSLSQSILRVETAAVVAATLFGVGRLEPEQFQSP